MGYHPRIESSDYASLVTTRSRNSELWFINNHRLEEAMLGYVAKYQERYSVELYALAIEGNHLHALAHFPRANRASFMRDLNSSVARAVTRLAPRYPGGRFWGRRYSNEFVPEDEDIEETFFYLALQPVQDGLVDHLSDFPGYHFFDDAINGRVRKCKVVNWTAYNEARRWHDDVRIEDFIETVELRFKRLPGYEHLSQAEYRELMLEKLEQRRVEAIKKRGTRAAGRAFLLKMLPGSRPKHTKTSLPTSHRPRVLCRCPTRRKRYLNWYFDTYARFKEASARYRAGEDDVEFPPGTFKPHRQCGAALKADLL